jgi:hypothetical protein
MRLLLGAVTFAAVLGINLREASAEDPPERYVTEWWTNASGNVSFFDNGSWRDLPPPSHKPTLAVYKAALGLWGVRMDDGHTAFVEFQSFRHSTGGRICERAANGKPQPLSTRNFTDGDCAK